jgi:hypothetical protein
MNEQYKEGFKRAAFRLLLETHNLRNDQAALDALSEAEQKNLKSPFVAVAAGALQGDRLIRLVRIFEDSSRTASFWYLHRCEPKNIGQGVDVIWLKDFSKRIKRVRDKTFVHIDKDSSFDAREIYRDANIRPSEIRKAIEVVWSVLDRVNSELRGSTPSTNRSFDELKDRFKSDLAALLKGDR